MHRKGKKFLTNTEFKFKKKSVANKKITNQFFFFLIFLFNKNNNKEKKEKI